MTNELLITLLVIICCTITSLVTWRLAEFYYTDLSEAELEQLLRESNATITDDGKIETL